MEGINLSSSTQEKRHRESLFSNGSLVVVFIFFFLLAFWGGMQWYLKMLNDDLKRNDVSLEESAAQLKGPEVDRIVSLDTRLTIAKAQRDTFTDTEKLLNQLENFVLPSVQLTKYEFNEKEKFVIVEGETDNFSYVAQQLINFKGEDLFAGMRVESLKKNETGRILFSFKADF